MLIEMETFAIKTKKRLGYALEVSTNHIS